MQIKFTAFGAAKPAGSKRAFAFKGKDGRIRATVVDACRDTKSWQHVIATAAREAYAGELLTRAVNLAVLFYFPRPKGHYNAKGMLRPAAPAFHVKRPDATKLLRAVEDSLTGIVWRDDAQVVQQLAGKVYGEPARCEVTITELAPRP